QTLIDNIDCIGLDNELCREILALANSTGIEILAAEAAKEEVPFVFELLALEPTLASLDWYMREVLQTLGWFKMETILQSDTCVELRLLHKYGSKWSLFLKNYLSSAFEIIMRERPQIT